MDKGLVNTNGPLSWVTQGLPMDAWQCGMGKLLRVSQDWGSLTRGGFAADLLGYDDQPWQVDPRGPHCPQFQICPLSSLSIGPGLGSGSQGKAPALPAQTQAPSPEYPVEGVNQLLPTDLHVQCHKCTHTHTRKDESSKLGEVSAYIRSQDGATSGKAEKADEERSRS